VFPWGVYVFLRDHFVYTYGFAILFTIIFAIAPIRVPETIGVIYPIRPNARFVPDPACTFLRSFACIVPALPFRRLSGIAIAPYAIAVAISLDLQVAARFACRLIGNVLIFPALVAWNLDGIGTRVANGNVIWKMAAGGTTLVIARKLYPLRAVVSSRAVLALAAGG
jgi:hypothetical protein